MPDTTVESHSHSCQYSNGSSWTEFGDVVERFTTHHGYQADRGTASISLIAIPSAITEGTEIICSIDGTTVFRGYVARPARHGIGQSQVLECEGRGAKLAMKWGGEGTDPELDEDFSRVYESQTTGAIITNLCEAMAIEVSMHSIVDDGVTRGTIYPVTLRIGQDPWSLIRGDNGLDIIRNYWTAERNDGVIVRALFEVGSADFTATEGVNILSADRTPQGNESIVNRCVVYGFEYEGATIGGIGVGSYQQDNEHIPDPPKSQAKVIRNSFIESDAESIETATLYVVAHNFPYDETHLSVPGNPSLTIGQTIQIDAPIGLAHAGDSSSLRFAAEVSHDYGVGVGYETKLVCIRVSNEA